MKSLACLWMLGAVAAPAARQPFQAADLWQWVGTSDPQISPDGRWIAYLEIQAEKQSDAQRSRLRLVSSDGKQRLPISQGAGDDSAPRWTYDSNWLGWVSSQNGKTQIRVRRMDNGRDSAIETPQVPLTLAWSVDGVRIAYTAWEPIAETLPSWIPPALLPRVWKPPSRHVALFVVPVSGGPPRRVSSGDFDYLGSPGWTPDGQSLVAARSDGAIYFVRVADGQEKRLTTQPGRNESPVVAPESGKIAWLTTNDLSRSYAVRTLSVMNGDGSRVKLLSGSLDRDASSPVWSSDSRTVYFLADDQGYTRLHAARNDGTVRPLATPREILRDLSLADNGRAVTIRSNAGAANEVISLAVDRPADVAVIAAPNQALLAEREAGAIEEMRTSSGAWSIQSWLLKPPGFDASKKYPLLLDIRDNPREMCGSAFDLEEQIFASHGYLVLCVNPRGTPGFGENFGNLLPSRYPGDDYDDLMGAVDAVLAKGYADPKRLVVMGGLLAAWTIGHTDRFVSAIARRPIVDWTVHVALHPDGTHRAAAWMGSLPWDNPDQYTKHSPISFAMNFKTPTLVLAEEGDPEGEELFWALRTRKAESTLARLPAHPKPSDRVLELETILAWLAR